ncbi:MAG: hypothetical protein EU544_04870, partial [Promethearchaeota archaeon]
MKNNVKPNRKSSPKTRKQKATLGAKILLVTFVSIGWIGIFINFDLLLNNEYHNLWVNCPSIVEQDEKFNITVEVWDKFERLAGGFDGEISLSIESYNFTSSGYGELSDTKWTAHDEDMEFSSNFIWKGLFPAYNFEGADNGKKEITVSIETIGIHYFQVKEKESGEEYRSNPVLV